MENISFNNRTYKVIEVKELSDAMAKNSNAHIQIIARGIRGAWKMFFMNTSTGNIVAVM